MHRHCFVSRVLMGCSFIGGGALLPLAAARPVLAQSHSGCYVEDNNQFYDLAALCGGTSTGIGEPNLQTGDIQVTLRWNTADDLDLVVLDPSGATVSYLNSAVPSGGQLDVDANGFCESSGFSPVENIFWPDGGAPIGNYSALVLLSIPCTERTTTVDYTLTILNQGDVQIYEGTVGQGVVSLPYDFTLN